MSDWKQRARALRLERRDLTIEDIAKMVGMSRASVCNAVKDIDHSPPWHDEVVALFATGEWSVRDLGKRFGRSRSQINRVLAAHSVARPEPQPDWRVEARRLFVAEECGIADLMQRFGRSRSIVQRALRGLPRSETQKAYRSQPRPRRTATSGPRPEPAWRAEARAMRMRRMAPAEIAKALGRSESSVRKAVANIVPPREWRQSCLEAMWAARRAMPKKPKAVPKPRSKPTLTAAERHQRTVMNRVRFLIGQDRVTREPAKVSLPRLSFLDDA